MKTPLKRREFISKSCKAGVACCALLYGSKLSAFGSMNYLNEDDIPDPKKLEYCGYTCPDDCKFLKASLENNTELKKKVYDEWKVQEKYKIDFDPEKIFCYKCKPGDKQEGIAVKNCTVRACAISKGYDCCIECDGLSTCDKELWTKYPEFRDMVIGIQKKYVAARGV